MLTVTVWLAVAYFMLPIAWLVINSTKDNSALFATFGLALPEEIALVENLTRCSRIKTASICAGSATPCSTPSSVRAGPL